MTLYESSTASRVTDSSELRRRRERREREQNRQKRQSPSAGGDFSIMRTLAQLIEDHPKRSIFIGLLAGAVATGTALREKMPFSATPNGVAQLEAGKSHRYYIVRDGDTLDGIVHRAYPGYPMYGNRFNTTAAEITQELPPNDQALGTVRPAEVLTLDPDSKVGSKKPPFWYKPPPSAGG